MKRFDWFLWLFVLLFTGTAIGWLTDYYEKVKSLERTEAVHAQLEWRVKYLEDKAIDSDKKREMCRQNLACDMGELARFLRSVGREVPELISERLCIGETEDAPEKGQQPQDGEQQHP